MDRQYLAKSQHYTVCLVSIRALCARHPLTVRAVCSAHTSHACTPWLHLQTSSAYEDKINNNPLDTVDTHFQCAHKPPHCTVHTLLRHQGDWVQCNIRNTYNTCSTRSIYMSARSLRELCSTCESKSSACAAHSAASCW